MLLAIDIETAPAKGFETYDRAALDHNRNRISLIATYDGTVGRTFREIGDFNRYLATLHVSTRYVFHNAKFDLKTLVHQGAAVSVDSLHEDTSLMGLALPDKIPDAWMVQYGVRRREANKLAGTNVHRDAGPNSLKTLAPYHLGVAPFWEVADHDNEEYAIKDAKYTWMLHGVLKEKLEAAGAYEFYTKHLLPWARMIMRAEQRGVAIDNELMDSMEAKTKVEMVSVSSQLDETWAGAHRAYHELLVAQERERYDGMRTIALDKLKNPTPERVAHTSQRYDKLCEKSLTTVPAKINLNSPDQLSWLLRDHLKLDIETFKGDKESTGKPVLQRLAGTRPDVRLFLQYRAHNKLLTSFFPTYREMQVRGVVHGSFNIDIARTGRLTSSDPNLQQVPGALHALFRARPNHKLICYDLSAIEPTVIAYLTECPVLCDLLISGGNFHSNNVRVFLGIDATDAEVKEHYPNERKLVKEVALSLFYGAGSERIRETGMKYGFTWSKQETRQMHQRFKERYETVFRYKRELDRVLEQGGTMQNVLGRILRIPDPANVYMQGFNTLVQSSASDMLLDAARRACDAHEGLHPLLFVHDEFISEVREEEATDADKVVKGAMEAFKLPTSYGMVPVVAEGGVHGYWAKG